MRPLLIAALIALGLLSGCATSTQVLPQPTPPKQRPTECLTPCPLLPALESEDEAATVIWAHEAIETAGQCRRMHETCRKAKH